MDWTPRAAGRRDWTRSAHKPHEVAGTFTSLGVPSFAWTPNLFPDVMAAAIQRRDLAQWAAARDIKIEQPKR